MAEEQRPDFREQPSTSSDFGELSPAAPESAAADRRAEPFQPDLERIRSLIRLARERGLNELTVEEAGERITVRLGPEAVEGVQLPAGGMRGPVVSRQRLRPTEPEPPPGEQPGIYTIAAPMVGVFYLTVAPDSPPYAAVGQHVDQGDIVGLIESMKIFNEIQSEFAGQVIEILVESEEMVTQGQPLMRIRIAETSLEEPRSAGPGNGGP